MKPVICPDCGASEGPETLECYGEDAEVKDYICYVCSEEFSITAAGQIERHGKNYGRC